MKGGRQLAWLASQRKARCHGEYDWNGRSRRIGCQRRGNRVCEDPGHAKANQISRQRRQPIVLACRPPVSDRDVPAIDGSGFAQARQNAASRCANLRVFAALDA